MWKVKGSTLAMLKGPEEPIVREGAALVKNTRPGVVVLQRYGRVLTTVFLFLSHSRRDDDDLGVIN